MQKIIGNGLLAKSFSGLGFSADCLILASGVSNSAEQRASEFRREFELVRNQIEDNPMFESKKAQRILRAYVEASQQSIDAKASIMLEHFIDNVVNKKKLKGVAKGMVVTQSIEAAIRYYLSLKKLLDQKNNPFNIMIAFSGEKEVDGTTYTEESLNGFNDAKWKRQ